MYSMICTCGHVEKSHTYDGVSTCQTCDDCNYFEYSGRDTK